MDEFLSRKKRANFFPSSLVINSLFILSPFSASIYESLENAFTSSQPEESFFRSEKHWPNYIKMLVNMLPRLIIIVEKENEGEEERRNDKLFLPTKVHSKSILQL